MTEISFRPIDQWPDGWRDNDRHVVRVPTPFRASYSDTLGLLGEELYHHDATSAGCAVAALGYELFEAGSDRVWAARLWWKARTRG